MHRRTSAGIFLVKRSPSSFPFFFPNCFEQPRFYDQTRGPHRPGRPRSGRCTRYGRLVQRGRRTPVKEQVSMNSVAVLERSTAARARRAAEEPNLEEVPARSKRSGRPPHTIWNWTKKKQNPSYTPPASLPPTTQLGHATQGSCSSI